MVFYPQKTAHFGWVKNHGPITANHEPRSAAPDPLATIPDPVRWLYVKF